MSIKIQRLIFTVMLGILLAVGLMFDRVAAINIYFITTVIMFAVYFIAVDLFDINFEKSSWIKELNFKEKIISMVNILQIILLVIVVL